MGQNRVMSPSEDRLLAHLVALTANGPRNSRSNPEALVAARRYVVDHLEEAGWVVETQPFRLGARVGSNDHTRPRNRLGLAFYRYLEGANIVARRPGVSGRALLVTGHLDSTGDSPGADDNATAVAAVLELATVLRHGEHPLILAVTDSEETSKHGAALLARTLAPEIAGVVNLELIGYFDDTPGAQPVPQALKLAYPAVAGFVAGRRYRRDFAVIVEDRRSAAIAAALLDGLTDAGMPAVRLRDPRPAGMLRHAVSLLVPPTAILDRSDHSRFWDRGIPAVMLVVGTPDGNPNYHRPSDTVETIDVARFALIVDGLARMAAGSVSAG
jgi:hypothetical protein